MKVTKVFSGLCFVVALLSGYVAAIAFWTIGVISVLKTALNLKSRLVSPDTVENCLGIGCLLSTILVKSNWIIASVKYEKETMNILEKSQKENHLFPNSCHQKNVLKSIVLQLGHAIIYCSMRLIQYNEPWDEWTSDYMMESRAYNLAHDAIVWTKNVTKTTEAFLNSFTDDINCASLLLGILSLVIEAVALYHVNLLKGAICMNALALQQKAEEFCDELTKPAAVVNNKISERVWKMYKHLTYMSAKQNAIYGVVNGYYHVESILLGAFFLYECVTFTIHTGGFFYLSFHVVRAIAFDIYVEKAAAANAKFKAWVLENFSDQTVIEIENHKSITLPALLAELDTQPIGLKTNSMLTGPVFQLVGGAVTYFFVMYSKN